MPSRDRDKLDEIFYTPLYSVAEAARLVGMTPTRVRRWLQGYSYEWGDVGAKRRGRQKPVVIRPDLAPGATFLDLMELLFVRAVLSHGISLQRIRKALSEAKAYLRSDHPFAQRVFFTLGTDLFLDLEQGEESILLELLSGGQLALREIILPIASRIDFDEDTGFASRYWPMGKDGRVLLDPRVCFGAPSLEHVSVRTSVVYDLYVAESRSMTTTSRWFGMDPQDVESAVEYESLLRAA